MSRPVHQDYIVRQRYSNALPPPPGAPKLLDIPTGGLKQYTMPTYASRLARIQPLNIEADGDLGMPIDLVGIPGVFEGNESAISKPLMPEPIHPGDANLIRPLKEIGQTRKDGGITFLRRTQFTAEGAAARGSGNMAQSNPLAIAPKRRRLDTSKEDPRSILRNVIKGFDIANPADAYNGPDTAGKVKGAQPTQAELDAWRKPKHPTKPSLTPLDFYPLLPKHDAIPIDGGYQVTRFQGHPGEVEGDTFKVPDSFRSDPRIEAALLQALEIPTEVGEAWRERLTKHERDPENHNHPGTIPLEYQFFLPEDLSVTFKSKDAFDTDATPQDRLNEKYTSKVEGDESSGFFRFKHARFYETRHGNDHATQYERVAVVLRDGPEEDEDDDLGLDDEEQVKLPKAAYYVPTHATHVLKAKRKITDKFGREETSEEKIDFLQVRVTDLSEEAAQKREEILSGFEDSAE